MNGAHDAAARRWCDRGQMANLRFAGAQLHRHAPRWSLVLGVDIGPAQVALCLIDLKLARAHARSGAARLNCQRRVRRAPAGGNEIMIPDLPFREVWAVDFEFAAPDGERPKPICLVARELKMGRTRSSMGG